MLSADTNDDEHGTRRARGPLGGDPRRPRRARFLRIAGSLAVAVLLLVGLVRWAPWRELGPPDERGRRLAYLERIVGRGSSATDPDAPLPMLVDVHGYGSIPDIHGRGWGPLRTVVRLIVPAGPDHAMAGRSWFPLDGERLHETIPEATDRLAALIEHLRATRPTVGKPLVTGYSQGGVLSFALAARRPEVVRAAFPVAGWLPVELIPERAPEGAPPVVALHGAEDGPEACREVVAALRERGWLAEARILPGVGHLDVRELSAELVVAVEASLAGP